MVAHVALDRLHSADAASGSRLAAYRDEHRDPAACRRGVFVGWLVDERGHLLRRLGDPLLDLPAIPFRKALGIASIVFVIGDAACLNLSPG